MVPRGVLGVLLRHLTCGLALIAVIMATFQIHVHVESSACTAHGGHHEVAWSLAGLADDPAAPGEDAPGCDACCCPSAPAGVPAQVLMASLTSCPAIIVTPGADLAAPADPAYPPDPPPLRLV